MQLVFAGGDLGGGVKVEQIDANIAIIAVQVSSWLKFGIILLLSSACDFIKAFWVCLHFSPLSSHLVFAFLRSVAKAAFALSLTSRKIDLKLN